MEPAAETNRLEIIKKESVKDGLYMGLFNVGVSLICWLIDPLFFVKVSGVGMLEMGIVIAIQCYFLSEIQKKVGKYWSFGEVLRASFFIFLISGLMYAIWSFIQYHVLDHSLSKKMLDATIAKTREMMASMKMPQETVDESLAKLKPEDMDAGNPVNIIKAFFFGVAIWMIVSVILAFIFKKEKPVVTSGS